MKTTQLVLLLLTLTTTLTYSYIIKNNPDAGDFTVFPAINQPGLSNTDFPTSMSFSPDGRLFIALKGGLVRIVDTNGNLEPNPWIDLSDRVNDAGDKGLTSLALHPNFPTTPYVYLTYPLWQSDTHDLNRVTQGVLARYTEENGAGVVSSELLLIGKTNGTGFPSCHNSHNTGDLVFGNDGTLFASAGDGAHWDTVDDGSIHPFDPYDWQCAPFFGADVAIGSFRAQHLNNLGGKVIRIDPLTGNGIGSTNFPTLVANPFFDSQNPSSFPSVIWTFGHRNPWRLRLRHDSPAPGTLYVAEVGAKDYEEINVIPAANRGRNYGWPCRIGDDHLQPWFTGTAVPTEYYVPDYIPTQSIIDSCTALNPNLTHDVDPLLYYSRSSYVYGDYIGVLGNCASGLSFYNGTNYPQAYRIQPDGSRTLFISDFGNQWIMAIRVDNNDQLIESAGVQEMLTNVGSILDMKYSPVNGDIYYLTEEGEVNRIEYTYGYIGSPIVTAGVTPTTLNIANRPAVFQFSSDGTFDPAGLGLTFAWSFGDGTTSKVPNPSHTYTTSAVFHVILNTTNAAGYSSITHLTVATNNDAPVATFTGPEWFLYPFDQGQLNNLSVSMTDSETPASQLTWQWEYRIVHNNHYHPNFLNLPLTSTYGTGATDSESQDMSSLISIYERNTLEVYVTVYDSAGASSRGRVRAVAVAPGNPNYENHPPTANFSATQTGSSIFADGSLSVDLDVDYLYYTWTWGDGTFGSGKVTYHTYSAPGTYNVNLHVVDPWNTTSDITYPVVIKTVPAYIPVGISNTLGSIQVSPVVSTFNPASSTNGQKGSASVVPLVPFLVILLVLLAL